VGKRAACLLVIGIAKITYLPWDFCSLHWHSSPHIMLTHFVAPWNPAFYIIPLFFSYTCSPCLMCLVALINMIWHTLIVAVIFIFFLWVTPLEVGGLCKRRGEGRGGVGGLLMGDVWDDDELVWIHLSENLEATFLKTFITLLGSHCCHLWVLLMTNMMICVLLPQVPDSFFSNFILPQVWLFVVFASVGKCLGRARMLCLDSL